MLRRSLLLITCFLVFCGARSWGQDNDNAISPEGLNTLQVMEDSLLVTADSMYHAFIPDEREGYSERFIRQLVKALKVPNSYYYPFDKLSKKINIIAPDDKAFRIFNWYISSTYVTKRYFGAIQMPEEQLKLYPLIDYSQQLGDNACDSPLTHSKWFGALYYHVITHDVDDHKVYTLFGLNANSSICNKKVLDPLEFTDKGPVFGAQIFNVMSENRPGQPVYRFILEYKKGVDASMNWDSERNVIYFDKLVSQVNQPDRKYTYVPSGQYDGLKWEDNEWKYITNLIPIKVLKDGEAPSGQAPFNAK